MKPSFAHETKIYKSPIGPLTITVNEIAVTGLHFGGKTEKSLAQKEEGRKNPLIEKALSQLEDYFAGRLKEFDLPLEAIGTEFQKRVWQNLLKIPYGETKSYREIAEMSNSPKGFRAVGMANNRNPIAIIIPCHRVIGADGSLTGFGGGLSLKEFLLRLEGHSFFPSKP
ncbi:MAG: methylated-DNA--[protein]-cysteine S-methyltransferase [Lachnospiraceae bacterium]|nr:methylated-DNA--[protein]-cysteine S-methyltransferase [Lachnospiraceae bacterium]